QAPSGPGASIRSEGTAASRASRSVQARSNRSSSSARSRGVKRRSSSPTGAILRRASGAASQRQRQDAFEKEPLVRDCVLDPVAAEAAGWYVPLDLLQQLVGAVQGDELGDRHVRGDAVSAASGAGEDRRGVYGGPQ